MGKKKTEEKNMPEFPMGCLYSIENKGPASSYPYTHRVPTSGPAPAVKMSLVSFQVSLAMRLLVLATWEAELQENKSDTAKQKDLALGLLTYKSMCHCGALSGELSRV